MSNPINNCVVIAIAAITGEAPERIVADLAAFPDKWGRPPFLDGDGVMQSSLENYLAPRGWEQVFFIDRPSMPWTCMINLSEPSHCFAIVDGCITDHYRGGYSEAQIVSIFVPPPQEAGGGLKI